MQVASCHADAPTLLVPYEGAGVPRARRDLAADLLGRGISRTLIEDALLVLSELLGNAWRHARPMSGEVGFEVGWTVGHDGILIEVTDGGGVTHPRLTTASVCALSGRGLSIVSALTRDWGVLHEGRRVTVGALLPLPAPSSATGGTVWCC